MSGMDTVTDQNLKLYADHCGDVQSMARELLAHRRASQAAPAPVAYRLRFAGEGAGDWGIVAPENAGYYIGRDGYECQPLYAATAPSDGLREAGSEDTPISRLEAAVKQLVADNTALIGGLQQVDLEWQAENQMLRKYLSQAVEDSDENGRDMICHWVENARAALSASPAQEGEPHHD